MAAVTTPTWLDLTPEQGLFVQCRTLWSTVFTLQAHPSRYAEGTTVVTLISDDEWDHE